MKSVRKQLFYIAPMLFWMSAIFFVSTQVGSADNTFPPLLLLLNLLEPGYGDRLPPEQYEAVHFFARKLAHFTEYAILTLLAIRAFQGGQPELKRATLPKAVLLSALYALSDELHQRFVPGRSGRMRDVGIDLAGILFAALSSWLWFHIKSLEQRLQSEHLEPRI